MKLNTKQDEALGLILRVRAQAKNHNKSQLGIITGGPGTGKTTVLKWAMQKLNPIDSVVLLAPTGKAALRLQEVTGVEAYTIHRALLGNSAGILGADLVIIDEMSMVDAELFAKLIAYLERSNPGVILVGDSDQLPSVGPGRVFGDILASGKAETVRLVEVQRAKERSWVCQNAPVILGGDIDLMPASDFVFIPAMEPAKVLEAVTQVWRKETANSRGFQLLAPMRKWDLGVDTMNVMLQRTRTEDALEAGTLELNDFLSTGSTRRLWRGDPVIHTKNNYSLGVFNGETGTVAAISKETDKGATGVHVMYPGNTGFKQYNPLLAEDELRLAYALTIHKSQGSEWDAVAVVCHDAHRVMWNKQLLYTAVTRSRGMVYLIGTESAVRHALRTDAPATRLTTLQERLRT
jgi:exodeoxyribonuclease V alpha subunit